MTLDRGQSRVDNPSEKTVSHPDAGVLVFGGILDDHGTAALATW
jgi:hypothetical protein